MSNNWWFLCLLTLHCQICFSKEVFNFFSSRPHLNNGSVLTNATQKDCKWRNGDEKTNEDICSDLEVSVILYSGADRQVVDLSKTDWLRQSVWNASKENILLVHGYAGGDDTLPISVLRDAYLQNGSYNVWLVDWGLLSQPPCYRAAIYNMKSVALCTANLLTAMRYSGLEPERTTCVGHSLGAHICGLISRYVKFRLHRIVGLDPARPLVSPTLRLDSGDAAAVHVLHTNAGNYGESRKSGHVDFCINGGRIQPFCGNTQSETLCSHVWVVCYMAESLNAQLAHKAEPCSRKCAAGSSSSNRPGIPIVMGQFTPLDSSGSYCVEDERVPYCPLNEGDPGDKRCCIDPS